MNDSTLINLNYLRTTCSNSQEMVQMILKMFVDSTPSLLEELMQNVTEKNRYQIKRNAHKAKSSFMTIGAKQTSDKLLEIELGAMDMPYENLQESVRIVIDEAQLVLDELKKL